MPKELVCSGPRSLTGYDAKHLAVFLMHRYYCAGTGSFDVYGGSARAIFDSAFDDRDFKMKTYALAKMSWATIATAEGAPLAVDDVSSTLFTILVPNGQQGAYTLLWACTF